MKAMHKIIFIFKTNMTVILISVVLVLAITFASAQDAPSKTTICREVRQGRYKHLNELLKPNHLRDIKLNNDGKPISSYRATNCRAPELNAECGFRIMPFTGLIFIQNYLRIK